MLEKEECSTQAKLVDTDGPLDSNYYKKIREIAGTEKCYWDENLNGWVVIGYAQCLNLFKSPNLSKSRLKFSEFKFPKEWDAILRRAQSIVDEQMSFVDSEIDESKNKNWRGIIQTRNSKELKNFIALTARQQIESYISNVSIDDFYHDVLKKYVSINAFATFGLYEYWDETVYRHVYNYADFLDGKHKTLVQIGEAALSIIYLMDWINLIVEEGHDLMSLAEDQSLENLMFCLVAAHESAAYMIGSALVSSSNPDGVIKVSDQSMNLFSETARFDSPIQLVGRRAVDDVVLSEKVCATLGDQVFLHVGAANRDPIEFKNPDIFSLERVEKKSLAFGAGSSKCIGNSLVFTQFKLFMDVLNDCSTTHNFRLDNFSYANGIAGRSFDKLSISATPLNT